jgi:lipoprotein-anchoring transpeptidase ErfK/SrfK
VFPHVPPSDHKNNPLGTRWIPIEGAGKDYGIHGTWEPDSIGKESSKGCIRMRNEDVQWLFDLIVAGESKITIKP